MKTKNREITSYKDLQLLFDEIHKAKNMEKAYLHKMLYGVRYLMSRLKSGESNAFQFMIKWCRVFLELQKKTVNDLNEYQHAITIAVSYIIGSLQYNTEHVNNYHLELLQAIDQLMENAKLTTLQNIGGLSKYTLMCLWCAMDYTSDFNTQFMVIKLMSIILKFTNDDEKKDEILQQLSTKSKWASTSILNQIVKQASHYGIFQNAIRDLLNDYNKASTEIQVFSLPCMSLTFGNDYPFYKPLNADEFWLDFNYGHYTLTFEGRFKSNVNKTYETVQVSVKAERLTLHSNILTVDFCAPITFSKVLNELEKLNKETKILLKLSEEETHRLKANYSSLLRFNRNAFLQRRSSSSLRSANNSDNNKSHNCNHEASNDTEGHDSETNINNINTDNDDNANHSNANHNCTATIQYCKNDNGTEEQNTSDLLTITISDSEVENLSPRKNFSRSNNEVTASSGIDISQSDAKTQNTSKCLRQKNANKSLEAPNNKRTYKRKSLQDHNDHTSTSDDSDNVPSCSSQKKLKIQNKKNISEIGNDTTKSAGKAKKRFFQTLDTPNDAKENSKQQRTDNHKLRKRRTAKNAKKPIVEPIEQNHTITTENNKQNNTSNNINTNYDEIMQQNSSAAVAALNSPTLQSTIFDKHFQRNQEKTMSTRKTNNSSNNNSNKNNNINESVLLSSTNDNSQKNRNNLTNVELGRNCGPKETSIIVSSPLNIDNSQTITTNRQSLLETSNSNCNEIIEYEKTAETEMDVLLTQNNQNTQVITPNEEIIMDHINLLVQQNLQVLTSTPLNMNSSINVTRTIGNINNSNEEDGNQLESTSQISFYLNHIYDITLRVLNQYECQQNEMLELKQNIGRHVKHFEWLYQIFKKRTEKFESFRQNTEYVLRLLECNLKIVIAEVFRRNT